jgi:monoterpene epsilon-lactone hydrolase
MMLRPQSKRRQALIEKCKTNEAEDYVVPLVIARRSIPAPVSISPEARASLVYRETTPYPDLDNTDAWRTLVTELDSGMLTRFKSRDEGADADVRAANLDGVKVFVITPANLDSGASNRVYFYIHGGSLIAGGGGGCREMGRLAIEQAKAAVWAIDYRMPPDHPYPAPLDDCVRVYRSLLKSHRPNQIVVCGPSAGGNLAAAMILRARDEGLPIPAAVVLHSPELDLTESGDSFQTNLGIDTVLTQSLMRPNELYANGHDLSLPYLSPLFGDFSKGFPPTLILTGTRDLFLSNSVRMHRALIHAGIPVYLHVFEAMPHYAFDGTTPEDRDAVDEIRRFTDASW